MSTRVKICGITNQDDALAAIAAGAHALGFVFYAASPRAVTPAQAGEIISSLPAFVTCVGLFVNADADEVEQTLRDAQLDLLQFHGDESPEYCAQFGCPWIKALRMKPELDLRAEMARFSQGRGILLDAYRPGVPGGTGEAFEWSRIPEDLRAEIILAGGLTPANVAAAVEQVRPFAVDVSGGVEAAKGIKDYVKIKQFIEEVACAYKN